MSEATLTAPTAPDTSRGTPNLDRAAGVGGVAFAAIIVVQNVLRASAPGFGAAPSTVASYFAHHRTPVVIPLGLFPVGMVALLMFIAGLWTRASTAEQRWWAHLGVLGAGGIVALFAIVNITEIALAAKPVALGTFKPLVQALWAVHAAAFGLNMAAVAVTLLGFGHVARSAGLVPRWIEIAAAPAAACLLAAATFTVAIASGAPWIALGFIGWLVWLIFAGVAGTAMIRASHSG